MNSLEAANRGVLLKKIFLKMLQYSQKVVGLQLNEKQTPTQVFSSEYF